MGGDASVKTFFSWLGVTYYLSTEAINTMLAALSELCADGSSLVFDYPDENFFDASEKRVQNTIMMAKAGDEPMQSAFSYSEIEKLLEKQGFPVSYTHLDVYKRQIRYHALVVSAASVFM